MHPILHSSSFLLLVITGFSFMDISTPLYYNEETNTTYLFQGEGQLTKDCGGRGLELKCQERNPVMEYMSEEYIVLQIKQMDQVLRIVRTDIFHTGCPKKLVNTTFDTALFDFAPSNETLTFVYNCTSRIPNSVPSSSICRSVPPTEGFYLEESTQCDHLTQSCKSRIEVPVLKSLQHMQPRLLVRDGFDLKSKDDLACVTSRGQCHYLLSSTAKSECVCNNSPIKPKPAEKNIWKWMIPLVVGCPVVFMVCLGFIIRHYKKKHSSSNLFSRAISSSRSDLEGGSVYFGLPLFSYCELQEATNNFDIERELGDGGFGAVFYGKLHDGREVAVKRLYEHNYKRVEQFINEVEILTRSRHKHLVTLYGCTSRHSRELLLVYEYISNGTVADHIHGDRATPSSLTWPTRMSIAIETASALAYLHASDIIHRDVKTTNILLDDNFCVKVADFGLSRLFPTDVSHVSTAPQGTPGYVDPEYHRCYQLTSKSDVYSFGVVLIELISSLPAVDIARHRHEINLANLAINKIEKCAFHELIDQHLGFQSDDEVKRMTISVASLAFQCLQQDKELRPSMDEVFEELKDIQSGKDGPKDQEKAYDVAGMLNVDPPTSSDCDDVGLLKNKKPPPSPNSVTDNWTSISNSTTPNISG